MYPVQLEVETTRVADGMSVSSSTPQRCLCRVAVGAAHISASDYTLRATQMHLKAGTHYPFERAVKDSQDVVGVAFSKKTACNKL